MGRHTDIDAVENASPKSIEGRTSDNFIPDPLPLMERVRGEGDYGVVVWHQTEPLLVAPPYNVVPKTRPLGSYTAPYGLEPSPLAEP